MEKLPVKIVDMPVTRVLNALQPRIEVPILFDRNGLAAKQIQLDETLVSFSSERTFYKRVFERVLFKARAEVEVRLDDVETRRLDLPVDATVERITLRQTQRELQLELSRLTRDTE